MRKILFWSAAILFAAISCNKEIDAPAASEEGPVTFTATVDGVDTKTVLGADKTPMWSGYELITVHNGTKGFTFETNAAEPALTANFSYNGDDFTGGKVLAVYPSGEYTVDVDNKTVEGINIPNPQILVADTYQTTAVFAAAYSEDNTLQFRNAVALLAFQVADADITKGCVYAGKGGGDLTGKYQLAISNVEEDGYDYEVPVLTATEANAWADFKLENDAAFATDKTYYIAVAPTTFSEGFGISLNGIDVKKTTKPVTFKRNVIYNLGLLELPEVSQNWAVCGSMNGWGDTEMILENDWYVAKSLTISTDDSFKFRTDKSWTVNRGGIGEKAIVDKEYTVSQNGADIKVAEEAVYDVYLSKAADKMKIVKVSDVVVPEPDPDFDFTNFPGESGKVVVYAESTYTNLYMWDSDDDTKYSGNWPGKASNGEVEIDGTKYQRFILENDDAVGKNVKMIFNRTINNVTEQTSNSAPMVGASIMIVDATAGKGEPAVIVASK